MGVYIILLLFVFLIGISNLRDKLKIILIFIPIIVVSAIRNQTVGIDVPSYLKIFNRIALSDFTNIFDDSYVEFGFALYCKLLSYINKDGRFFIAITSFVICFFVLKTIYLYSDDIGLSSFLFIGQYYLFYSYSAIRQYLALSIAFYAFSLFIHNNKKKGIIFLFIAISFHYTSAIYVPAFILSRFKINKKNIILLVVGVVAVAISYKFILINAINSFDRFAYYRDNDMFSGGRGFDINVLLYIFQGLLIVLSIIMLYKQIQLNKQQKKYKRLNGIKYYKEIINDSLDVDIFSYMICIVFALGFNIASITLGSAARISQYFFIFSLLNIPILINSFNKREQMIIKISLYFVFFVYCVLMLSHNNYGVVPYSSFLFE